MADRSKNDILKIVTPAGTREAYARVARIAGLSPTEWYREALRQVAEEVLEEHDVALTLPPVHLRRPKRLQPRIRVRRSVREEVARRLAEDEQ